MAGDLMWSPELISSTIVGVCTVLATLIIGMLTFCVLRKQTKILELLHQPKLFITNGKFIFNYEFPVYQFNIQNDSDTPAYNVQYYFRCIEQSNVDDEQLIDLINNFDKDDILVNTIGVISKNKPAIINLVNLPSRLQRWQDEFLELPLGTEIKIVLCGFIKIDDSEPILVSEYIYTDSEITPTWKINSIAINPLKLKKFKDTVEKKMKDKGYNI